MKKIISIVLSLVMILSFSQMAFASEWDFLDKQYESYDAEMELWLELNKPLEFVDDMTGELPVDVQYIAENLLKSKIKMNVQANMGSDMKSGEAYIKYNLNIPVNVSEDLKFGADTTFHMWIEYDLTSVENAKMKIIYKNPLKDGMYFVMDAFDKELYDGDAETLGEVKKQLIKAVGGFDNNNMKELTEIGKKAYSENSAIMKTKDGYKITMTNNQMIDFVVSLISDMFESDYMKSLGVDFGASMGEMYGAANVNAEQVVAIVKAMGIFADDEALCYDIKLDNKGFIAEGTERIRFDFNVFDAAMLLGASEIDIFPFTKENSDISFDVCATVKYNKINEGITVAMPILTEENSVSMADLMATATPEPDVALPDIDETIYVDETYLEYADGTTSRGVFYVDYESFIDSASGSGDNLSGSVNVDEWGNVVLKMASVNFPEVTVTGNVYRDNYKVNEYDVRLKKPFMICNDYDWETYEPVQKVYINMDILKYTLAAKIESYEAYLLDENGIELVHPECWLWIVRPNPAYTQE